MEAKLTVRVHEGARPGCGPFRWIVAEPVYGSEWLATGIEETHDEAQRVGEIALARIVPGPNYAALSLRMLGNVARSAPALPKGGA